MFDTTILRQHRANMLRLYEGLRREGAHALVLAYPSIRLTIDYGTARVDVLHVPFCPQEPDEAFYVSIYGQRPPASRDPRDNRHLSAMMLMTEIHINPELVPFIREECDPEIVAHAQGFTEIRLKGIGVAIPFLKV